MTTSQHNVLHMPLNVELYEANSPHMETMAAVAKEQGVTEDVVTAESPVLVSTEQPLHQGTYNNATKTEQEPLALVHSGGDIFGIVKVQSHNEAGVTTGYAITQWTTKHDERAKILGFLRKDEPFSIGGNHQAGLNKFTAPEQCQMTLTAKGIQVAAPAEADALRGTSVVYRPSNEQVQTPQHAARFGLQGLKKRVSARQTNTPAAEALNPLEKYKAWSASSAEAKQALEDAFPSQIHLSEYIGDQRNHQVKLHIDTVDGRVTLTPLKQKGLYGVLESDSAAFQSGDSITLRGDASKGIGEVDTLVPGQPLAYQKQRSEIVTVGERDEPGMISVKTLERYRTYDEAYGTQYVRPVGPNQVKLTRVDPKIRQTSALKSAELSVLDASFKSQTTRLF